MKVAHAEEERGFTLNYATAYTGKDRMVATFAGP